jgi:hypothetical protein
MEMNPRNSPGAAQPDALTPTAFISYSRKDIAFVDRLEGALKAHSIDARVDRTDIEKGEEWWTRIKRLIAEAYTVIFVLSPDSAISPTCQQEVAFAEGLKKRLIAIIARDMAGKAAPAAGWEGSRSLNLFQEPTRPLSRERQAAPAFRERVTASKPACRRRRRRRQPRHPAPCMIRTSPLYRFRQAFPTRRCNIWPPCR